MAGRRLALAWNVDVTINIRVRKRHNLHLMTTCMNGTLACFILEKPGDDTHFLFEFRFLCLTVIRNEMASES